MSVETYALLAMVIICTWIIIYRLLDTLVKWHQEAPGTFVDSATIQKPERLDWHEAKKAQEDEPRLP